MYITMVIGDEWILKLFANFHKHHYWTIDCDEYLLKHFANFHVHHYGDKCQLKFFFANFHVQQPANSVQFTKFLDSDASS